MFRAKAALRPSTRLNDFAASPTTSFHQGTLHTRVSTRSALAANGVGWVIPVTASNGSAQRSGGARPHNVTQLFSSSTHRVGAHNGMSAHVTFSVFHR